MTDYITTEDFIREVEELGFRHKRGVFNLYIKDNGRPIAGVNLYQPLQLDTCYDNLNYKNPTHLSLYELINRYARTPLDERVIKRRRQPTVNENNRGKNDEK